MAIVDVDQIMDEALGKQKPGLDVDALMDEQEQETLTPAQEPFGSRPLDRFILDSADLAVAMLGGSGFSEAVGVGVENPVSAATMGEEVKPIPSIVEDVKEGRTLDTTLKAIGVAGDALQLGGAYTAATGLGAIPGGIMFGAGTGLKFGAKAVSKYGDQIQDGLRKLFDLDPEAAERAAERIDTFADDDKPIGAAISTINAETKKTRKAAAPPSLVTQPNRVSINVEPDEAGLYSRLDASLDNAPEKANSRQWLKFFRDQGIRTDELSLRLPEINDDVSNTFSLEEVQTMLRERPITIRDRELSYNPNSTIQPTYDVDDTGDLTLRPGTGSNLAAARLGDVAGTPQYGSFRLVIPDKSGRATTGEIARGDAAIFNYREFPVQVTSKIRRGGVSQEITEDQARLIDETELVMEDASVPLRELDEDIMNVVRMKHAELADRGLGFEDADEFYEKWAEHHFYDYIVEYAQGDAMLFMEMTTSSPQIAGIIADIELQGGGDIFARKFRDAVEELGVLPTQSANMLKTLTSSVPLHRNAMGELEAAIRSRAVAKGQNDQSIINQLERNEPSEVFDAYLQALQGDISNFDYVARHFEGLDTGSNFAENTVAHYRTTDRVKGDKKYLLVEEVQSDAFGSDKADMPMDLPGRDNNYQRMVLALATRRAVMEGYDGIAFANADQVRNVNGRAVFTQYENIDVTTRTGEKATSFIKNSTQDGFFHSNINPNEFTQADYDTADLKIGPNADTRDRLIEVQKAFVRRALAQGDVKVVKLRKTGSGEAPHYALFDKDGLFIGSSDRNIFETANEIQLSNDGATRASTTQVFGGAVGGEIMANKRLKMDASFDFGTVNDGYTDVYDRAMPKRVDEFLRALGDPVKKATIELDDADGKNMAIEFTDEFKELVEGKGVPMMRKGGLAQKKAPRQ
jgi:hypothetical protein